MAGPDWCSEEVWIRMSSCGHEDPSQTNAKEREESTRMGPRGPGLRDKQRKTFLEAKKVSRKVGDIGRENCY